MTQKRWAYFALGAVAGIGIGAVTNVVAQSVYPVRFDDSQAAASYPAEGETEDGAPLASAPGSGAEALTVEGEVRTVDASGKSRLWGRGRSGVVVYLEEGESKLCRSGWGSLYGLSNVLVDWGSVADGCPAGFWVCTGYELGPSNNCDTRRPDTSAEGRSCSGQAMNWSADQHRGWLAGAASSSTGEAWYLIEGNPTSYTADTCNNFPVWCCTE